MDAEGWGGDRYALYGRGTRRRLIMRWRFDTPAALKRFVPALREGTEELRGARIVPGADSVTMVLSKA